MIGDLESCNVMSDGLCTAHNQDGRLCRKQAVDEWDRLRLKHEETLLQIREALVGLELLEQNCPCGARSEPPDTHPHVTNCLVEVILRKLRGNTAKGPVSTQRVEHCNSVYCINGDKCQCQCAACLAIVNF